MQGPWPHDVFEALCHWSEGLQHAKGCRTGFEHESTSGKWATPPDIVLEVTRNYWQVRVERADLVGPADCIRNGGRRTQFRGWADQAKTVQAQRQVQLSGLDQPSIGATWPNPQAPGLGAWPGISAVWSILPRGGTPYSILHLGVYPSTSSGSSAKLVEHATTKLCKFWLEVGSNMVDSWYIPHQMFPGCMSRTTASDIGFDALLEGKRNLWPPLHTNRTWSMVFPPCIKMWISGIPSGCF